MILWSSCSDLLQISTSCSVVFGIQSLDSIILSQDISLSLEIIFSVSLVMHCWWLSDLYGLRFMICRRFLGNLLIYSSISGAKCLSLSDMDNIYIFMMIDMIIYVISQIIYICIFVSRIYRKGIVWLMGNWVRKNPLCGGGYFIIFKKWFLIISLFCFFI